MTRVYSRLITMTFDPGTLVQGFWIPFTWRHFRWSMGQRTKGENTCIVQTRILNIGLLQKVVLWIDKRMDRCKLSTFGYLQSKAQINLYLHPLMTIPMFMWISASQIEQLTAKVITVCQKKPNQNWKNSDILNQMKDLLDSLTEKYIHLFFCNPYTKW